MQRVQVQLTADQLRTLRARGAATNQSVAALVREAVEAWVAADERRRQVDRALAAVGEFRSGLGNLAEEHDHYLEDDRG